MPAVWVKIQTPHPYQWITHEQTAQILMSFTSIPPHPPPTWWNLAALLWHSHALLLMLICLICNSIGSLCKLNAIKTNKDYIVLKMLVVNGFYSHTISLNLHKQRLSARWQCMSQKWLMPQDSAQTQHQVYTYRYFLSTCLFSFFKKKI